jgi:hypothetical protein
LYIAGDVPKFYANNINGLQNKCSFSTARGYAKYYCGREEEEEEEKVNPAFVLKKTPFIRSGLCVLVKDRFPCFIRDNDW